MQIRISRCKIDCHRAKEELLISLIMTLLVVCWRKLKIICFSVDLLHMIYYIMTLKFETAIFIVAYALPPPAL